MSEFQDYVAHGWKLCAIDRGKKAPVYEGWNVTPIPDDAVEGLDGAGLLHALSGTCALDLDALELARPWLAERGVDVDALLDAPDAVRIDSGRPGRAKLIYRMKRPLRTYQPKGSGLELRCATGTGSSVQDVLPPTIHPDTKKPYTWLYGEPLTCHWSAPPPIPANLLSLWRGLGAEESEPVRMEAVERSQPVNLTQLKRAAFKHDPNCEHDEWLRVGMQLHDGTGGAQEGFDIWTEWSAKATRDQQGKPGVKVFQPELMRVRWLSFGSGAGKHVASGSALASELPADADEFPIEPIESADGETTEKALKETAREIRAASYARLEARLVYVHSAERYFDTERHKIIGSDSAIEHMFTSMMPAKKGGRVNPVKVLKESATKKYVDAVGFHPGEGVIFNHEGDSFANTYRNKIPAPLVPRPDELERIQWLFDRIDDVPYREWLLQFFGHVVQKPGVKIKSAPLIWSETQGNGKTTLLKMIPALLVGHRYSKEVTFSLLNSDFNDYLLNAWHVNLTEFRAGTRGEREAISKKIENWIADDTISIHPKGLPGYTMPNHVFITATSNKDDAASIDNNDRKWSIHEMHAPQFTEAEQEWMYNGFLLTPRAPGVLRHYFLHTPLLGFSASARALETEAKSKMVDSSTPLDFELLQTAWEQQSEPMDRDIVLTAEIAEYVRKHSISKPSNNRIGRLLCRPPFNGTPIQFRVGNSIYRGIVIRNQKNWAGATGRDIMAHISGEDVDLTS